MYSLRISTLIKIIPVLGSSFTFLGNYCKSNYQFTLNLSNHLTFKIRQKKSTEKLKKIPLVIFLFQFFRPKKISGIFMYWRLHVIERNEKWLNPMSVVQFVDFRGTGRGVSSKPVGWRGRCLYNALVREGRPWISEHVSRSALVSAVRSKRHLAWLGNIRAEHWFNHPNKEYFME